jgi:hypothetical protein
VSDLPASGLKVNSCPSCGKLALSTVFPVPFPILFITAVLLV